MPIPCSIRLARNAMATRFELLLQGDDERGLRAAGEEALDEIERLDERLSFFRRSSEVAGINLKASTQPVPVSPEVFRLIKRAIHLSKETAGAFDITVGPLIKAWGLSSQQGGVPSDEELNRALTLVGPDRIILNEADFTVQFDRPGVNIDLGAIGKGYALENAAHLLRVAGVTSALIHGGTSTAVTIGRQSEEEDWKIAIEGRNSNNEMEILGSLRLKDQALSVSAVWGKEIELGGRKYGHILDPRTGMPVTDAELAAVTAPSATDSDALSTALLTLGFEGHGLVERFGSGMGTLVAKSQAEALGAGEKRKRWKISVQAMRFEEIR